MNALVVYYSRTGNTRKVAETIAEQLRSRSKVVVEELVDTCDRSGMSGWLGAGKDASLKRLVPIQPVKADVASFDLVIVGTPVWAFTMAAAPRAFLTAHADRIKRAAFFCTTGGTGIKGTFTAMQEVSHKSPVATLAITARELKDPETIRAKVKTFVETLIS